MERLGDEVTVNPIKLETGIRPNSAGILYLLLLRIEAIGFPTFFLASAVEGLLKREPQGFCRGGL